MTSFEYLIHTIVGLRNSLHSDGDSTAHQVGTLYEEPGVGEVVSNALLDDFFPLTLYERHYLGKDNKHAQKHLALLSKMFLRIRKDIKQYFGNTKTTCIDLDGDAFQRISSDQWCSFCGECCQLPGTIPDPPDSIRYPGYWYSYIAGDGPLVQKFCPFLFELPPQRLFFCAIHNIKPLTCLAYGKQDCLKRHPGKARL